MTEEDTFKKLKRTPFKDLAVKWALYPNYGEKDYETFLAENGWTWDEYTDEYSIHSDLLEYKIVK